MCFKSKTNLPGELDNQSGSGTTCSKAYLGRLCVCVFHAETGAPCWPDLIFEEKLEIWIFMKTSQFKKS